MSLSAWWLSTGPSINFAKLWYKIVKDYHPRLLFWTLWRIFCFIFEWFLQWSLIYYLVLLDFLHYCRWNVVFAEAFQEFSSIPVCLTESCEEMFEFSKFRLLVVNVMSLSAWWLSAGPLVNPVSNLSSCGMKLWR